MKNKKDIFDLFRDNEHKLDERPDGKLWDRLEGRLDQSLEPHRAPSRNGWKQWMSMAGVMLALIVVISLANIMLRGGMEDEQQAENVGVMVSLEMEEIGIFSDKGPNYTVGEYQKMLARLNTNPILEGDPSKKIRIQESVFASLDQRSKEQIASVDKILKAEEAVNAKKTKKTEPEKKETRYEESGKVILADASEVVEEKEMEENSFKTEGDAVADTYSNRAEADMVVDEITTSSAPAPVVATLGVEEMIAEDVDVLSIEEGNSISVSAVEAQAGIQQFEWLLGKWEAPTTDMEQVVSTASTSRAKKSKKESAKMATKDVADLNHSVEEWKPLDEFTIEGQGYLVVNGDTTFTESMQIKKIGSDLYYILALDNSGKQVQYKLKTYTEEAGAVFENEDVAFPNQVILQRDFSNSNFTTVLQNKTPAQINTDQQEYFQNRNVIRSENVKRIMNRVEN